MKIFLGVLAILVVAGFVGFVGISRRFDRIRKSEDARKAKRQRELVEGGLNAELDYIIDQLDREMDKSPETRDGSTGDRRERLRELRTILLDNRDRVPQPFDAAMVVEDEVAACRALDGLKGRIELASPASGTPPVVGTPALLRWAVRELISNTLTHTGTWTRIDVRLEPDHDGENEGMVLSVMDDGQGPDIMAVSRLYGAFTPRIGSPGPGLGLFAVRSIVESMGGAIQASPGSDGGLTHTVRLPSRVDTDSRLPSIARMAD